MTSRETTAPGAGAAPGANLYNRHNSLSERPCQSFSHHAPSPYPAPALAQRATEPLDAPAGILENLGRRRIGQPEIRPKPEGGAVHHRDALGFEQLGNEVLVRLDRVAGWGLAADRLGARRIDVERSFRHGALQVA